jgi:pyruvate dehydrogenase E2 component (dihydrolipoamide acetyltransferase)
VPGGVMIPVLQHLTGASLGAIAAQRVRMAQQARTGRFSSGYHGAAAISLSNLGSTGVDRFEAIISPGQTAILAVGRIHERVVPRGRAIGVGSGFYLNLSVDHRLIDGVAAAQFLGTLAQRIEQGPWA